MNGWREVAKAVLKLGPYQAILCRVQGTGAGRRLLNSVSGARGIFPTFEEAWSVARRTGQPGHEDPEHINFLLEISSMIRPSDYAVLFWLSATCKDNFRIFDFGGNVGNLFYSYRPYLTRLGSIQWTVFDLPALLEKGMAIAQEKKACQLRFVTSVNEFSSEQVLLVSGALHYWEKTLAEFVNQFPVRPRHILIQRTPIHESLPSFITVQKTETCAVPCMVRNAGEMISEFAALGYTLVDRWQSLERHLILPLFPDHSVFHYSGFYFRSST